MVLGTAKAVHPSTLTDMSFSRTLSYREIVLLHISTQSFTGLDSIQSKTVRRFEIEMIFLNFLKIINFNWIKKIFFIY
jgi:hypothetical protein